MNTTEVLHDLASKQGFDMPEKLYEYAPEGVNRTYFMGLVSRMAGELLEYGYPDMEQENVSTMVDELSDPNRDHPYEADKWNYVHALSLWASSDIEYEANDYVDNYLDSGMRQGDYLFGVLDGYIYGVNKRAINAVIQYLFELAFQDNKAGI